MGSDVRVSPDAMRIYLGADHRGFLLKEALKKELGGHEIFDVGAGTLVPDDDYADFAAAVGERVAADPANSKGILICGSGHGMDMVANKFKEVRAALCFNKAVAKQSREHENANVLVLPADWLEEAEAKDILKTWLEAEFGGAERNGRRLGKIAEIETKNFH